MSLVLVSPSQEIALNVLAIFFFNNFPKISLDKVASVNYMKGENIEINIETFTGKRNFTAYTMDLTKKYIEINADYRS